MGNIGGMNVKREKCLGKCSWGGSRQCRHEFAVWGSEAARGPAVGTELPQRWGDSCALTPGTGEAALHLHPNGDMPVCQLSVVLWCLPC